MSKVFYGLDNSVSSPGLVALNEDGSIKWLKFYAHKTKHIGQLSDVLFGIPYPDLYSSEEDRFHKLSELTLQTMLDEIKEGNEIVVGMEGYSFGSSGSRLFQLAENSGLIKHKMYMNGIDFKLVPPTVVKKLATGKGNCQKDLVYEAFAKETGINLFELLGSKSTKVGSPMGDIADAYWMARWIMEQK